MNIIKIILGAIGLVFVGMLLLWALGWIGALLSWVFWLGLVGSIGYGGYRLFLRIERKSLGADTHGGLGTGDIQMSWDEYDKKYLHK